MRKTAPTGPPLVHTDAVWCVACMYIHTVHTYIPYIKVPPCTYIHTRYVRAVSHLNPSFNVHGAAGSRNGSAKSKRSAALLTVDLRGNTREPAWRLSLPWFPVTDFHTTKGNGPNQTRNYVRRNSLMDPKIRRQRGETGFTRIKGIAKWSFEPPGWPAARGGIGRR